MEERGKQLLSKTHIRPADVSKFNASTCILREGEGEKKTKKKQGVSCEKKKKEERKNISSPSFSSQLPGKYNASVLSLIQDSVAMMTGSIFDHAGKMGAMQRGAEKNNRGGQTPCV